MFIDDESGLPAGLLLSKSKGNNSNDRVLLFSHARGAMEFFLKNCSDDRKTIIGPGYNCADYYDSVSSCGFRLKHYRIDAQFRPEYDSLINEVDDDTLAVVIVHYFGFVTRHVEKIVACCRRRNIIVIEDFAHCLYCDMTVSRIRGDMAIFSLKKTLPIPDGGLLYDNSGAVTQSLHNYDQLERYNKHAYTKICKLLLKAYLEKISWYPSRHFGLNTDDDTDESYEGPKRVSRASEAIISRVYSSGYADYIKSRRRCNFFKLVSLISDLDSGRFELPFKKLQFGDVPYILPVRSDCNIRGVVKRLRCNGLPVMSWPRLDPKSDVFDDCEKIRNKLIFFPLHEHIYSKQLEYMMKFLKITP